MQHSCLTERGLQVLITDFPSHLNLIRAYVDRLKISAELVECQSSKLHKLVPTQTNAFK